MNRADVSPASIGTAIHASGHVTPVSRVPGGCEVAGWYLNTYLQRHLSEAAATSAALCEMRHINKRTLYYRSKTSRNIAKHMPARR